MATSTSILDEALAAAPIIDGHNDLPAALRIFHGSEVSGFGAGLEDLQTDLGRLRAGRVGAQFWSIWVPTHLPAGEAVQATIEQVELALRLVETYPDDLTLAVTADDVQHAVAQGRIACLLGVEGGHSVSGSLPVLRFLARLGVRYLTLTHDRHTDWADSATDERPGVGGLTDVGREIVAEAVRLGVMIDLAHTAAGTQRAVLDETTVPVIFSHAGTRAVNPRSRGVTDDVLAMLPASDSVFQVAFHPQGVSPDVAAWAQEAAAERARLGFAPSPQRFWQPVPEPGQTTGAAKADSDAIRAEDRAAGARAAFESWVAQHPCPEATLAQVADHVEHVREVAGVDHVGLGSDFDGMFTAPAGLPDVSAFPALLAELADRRWSAQELAALAGGNVLRVMRATEAAASDKPHHVLGGQGR